MLRIFLTEFKKLVKINRLPLVILLAITVRAVLCFLPQVHEHPYSDEVYKRYTTQLEGELTSDKIKNLNTRLAEIDELIAIYDEMQQSYASGELTLDEYSAYTEQHGKAKAEESTVRYLCSKCEILDGCTDFDKQIFCDTAWNDFFEDNGFDYVMLIALLCIAVPAFDAEYSSGSFKQIITSKRGKTQLALSKLAAVWAAIFVLSCLMSAVMLAVFVYRNGLEYSKMPVGNILLTDGFGDTSLIVYYLKYTLLKALIWAMYSCLFCLIAVLFKNITFAIITGFIIGITPQIISTGVESERAVYYISGIQLGKMYGANVRLWLLAGIILIKSVLLSVAVSMAWSKKA
ncbi:MAG: hypothetical protein IJM75_01915 [Ruminococcus sp.]|nr:hypothetical protein [Ruminococcus sp.]